MHIASTFLLYSCSVAILCTNQYSRLEYTPAASCSPVILAKCSSPLHLHLHLYHYRHRLRYQNHQLPLHLHLHIRYQIASTRGLCFLRSIKTNQIPKMTLMLTPIPTVLECQLVETSSLASSPLLQNYSNRDFQTMHVV